MKKGNVEIIESDGGYRILSKRDYLGRAFWIPEQDLKDLHSLLSELLETETAEVSNLGFIRQYLGEVPPDRTFTAKELWEVFNAFAPLMSEEIEKKMVESLKNLLDTLTVKEEVPMGASQWMAHGKNMGIVNISFVKNVFILSVFLVEMLSVNVNAIDQRKSQPHQRRSAVF